MSNQQQLMPETGAGLACLLCPLETIYAHEQCSSAAWISCCASSCGCCWCHYMTYQPMQKPAGTPMEEPDAVTKFCCARGATYYHEGEVNAKTLLGCLFGCCYTLPFYTPTWAEGKVQAMGAPEEKTMER